MTSARDRDPTQANNDTLLAFDFGLRRIGVAVGNVTLDTASALTTLTATRDGPDFAAIGALVADWRPARLIVGVPRNMDGTRSDMTRAAERFVRELERRFGLPVDAVDERLTSVEAQDIIRQARRGGRRRRARPDDVDKLAAQVILRSWLDQQRTP